MEKYDLKNLKKDVSKYALTNDSLNELLDTLKKAIIDNSNIITDANKEDVKISKKQIKIKKLLDIIEKYRNKELEHLEKSSRKIVIYKGDPYITLHVCMQALIKQTKVLLMHDEFMVGVNKVLIKVFQNVLNKFEIDNLVDEIKDYSINDVNDLNSLYDVIIVIGDTYIYQLLKADNKNVKFFAYNNIALYCESDDLIKLQEAIYIYANENQYEIEIIYCDNIKDAIKLINIDPYKNMAILLTRSNENKDIFKNEINNKDVYVNDNPFKEELGRIYNYLG